MRKLKLQMQLTLDGFVAGPNGEMDWMTMPWTDDVNTYVGKITEPVDTIVLGRKLAEGFIPYWASVAANPEGPEVESGRKFTDTHKVVFTKTLNPSDEVVTGWNNTVLAKGDLAGEITNLKKQNGRDIIAYGGAAFASALIQHRLIDEFHLFINPTAIGTGMTIFKELNSKQELTLVKSTAFDCGIVVHHYEPKKS